MIGIIIQLIASWSIIWLLEKRSLSVLGFRPTKERLFHFLLFFFITAICCATGFFIKMYVGQQHWKLNPSLSIELVFNGIWWNIKSVLFEELIFRGVLLYILIKRLGMSKAIIISAAAFGVYHWFSFGVIGNVNQMIITFIITGVMGLLLAYAYAKTLSLYIPSAIHLGWNITQIFIFSQGPIGNGIFIATGQTPFRTDSYLLFFLIMLLPVVIALLTNYLLLKRLKKRV